MEEQGENSIFVYIYLEGVNKESKPYHFIIYSKWFKKNILSTLGISKSHLLATSHPKPII